MPSGSATRVKQPMSEEEEARKLDEEAARLRQEEEFHRERLCEDYYTDDKGWRTVRRY